MGSGLCRLFFIRRALLIVGVVTWLAISAGSQSKSYYVTITELQAMGNNAYARNLRAAKGTCVFLCRCLLSPELPGFPIHRAALSAMRGELTMPTATNPGGQCLPPYPSL